MSKQKNTPVGANQQMTPREIRANLILNGVTNRAIAEKLKVHPSAVTLIITGQKRSRRIQEAVAAAINRPFYEVWGKQTA